MKTTGNTIFLTGGTSGIGHGLALKFHEAGNKVIVSGRRAELLDRIAADNPGIETVVLDVDDPASISAAFHEVTTRHPDTNVVVNVAGIMLPEDLLDPGHLAVAEATVTTNLLGPIRVLSHFTPFLAAKADAAVINISSGLAFVPFPATPTYSATKAGLHAFTEILRVQLSGTSVQVIEIVPPAVRTTLMGQQDNEQMMPLDAFLDEAFGLLESTPDADEILVEGVKFLRFAEASGNYATILSALDLHARS